jgi:hypothetical protein
LLECLAHVALAFGQALGWLGAGTLVLAPLGRTGDRPLDLLNRVGAGAVAFALLTFGVGWLGFLHAELFVPLFAAAAVVGAVELARNVRGARLPAFASWARWEVALGAVIAVYLLIDLLVTCAPISSADALFHHAGVPEVFEREHRLEEVPWSWHSYQPFTTELLVLDGFLLWDSVQGAFAALLLGFAGAGTVLVGAHRLVGRSVALVATALFVAQPFAVWLFTSTFVEPAAAFTLALAVVNLIRFVRGAALEALVLAGLFTGATAGMKYIAAAAAAVVAATALVLLWRRLSVRLVAAFALPALAVSLPWYVKNAILTGDPAYPILLGWENEEAQQAAEDSFANYGYGHSLLDFLLLPVRLLADAEPFDRAEFITPLFLLFAPVALLDRRLRRPIVVALGAVAAFVVVWFVGVQDSRYLFLAMPVLAVLAALGLFALAREGRVGRFLAIGGTVAALAVGAGVTVAYASQFAPVVVGLQSEEEFLREEVSYHEGVEWLNSNLPDGARVAVDFVFVLHVDRPTVGWTSDALPTTAGPREMREFVRRYGLTHALVFENNAGRRQQLSSVGARRIARVTVHPVLSRTRSTVGPPESMDVYRIPSVR